MLLIVFFGQAQEIIIFDPTSPFRPSKSSGPRNISISAHFFTPLEIDLNEDGINDISFDGQYYITADHPTSGGGGWISINTLNNYIWSDNRHALPRFSPIQLGEPSTQNGSFNKGSFLISSYSDNFIDGTTTGWTGPWSDIDIGYLSILFTDSSNQLHAASIRLLVPDDSGIFMSMYIMDWSYEIDPLPEPSSTEYALMPYDDTFHMSFSVHNGLKYALEHCTNLVDGIWVTNAFHTSTANTLSITNDIDSEVGFWRLKRMP